jgi:glycosyltransferase involved in cell wall biosynthesis
VALAPRKTRRDDGVVLIINALAARFGGTAYAIVQLAAALGRRPDVHAVHVVTQRDSIVARGLTSDEVVRLLVLPAPDRGELAWRVSWEAIRLPRLIARTGADAVFSASGIQPRRLSTRLISLLANPVPYVDRSRPANVLRRVAIRHTCRHADAVYVPSSHMATLVGRDAPAQVVPLGVDRRLFRPVEGSGEEILYVGDFYPHKRHDLALEAWRLLDEPRPTLRLIGNPDVDRVWFQRIYNGVDDPRVVIRPRVALGELLGAYASARVVLLPSERESFSMPLAEAICAGVPALVRDDPVLLETGGPGALAVPEQTPRAWADALRTILEDRDLHKRIRTAGIRYGERYSWEVMADQLVRDATSSRA